MPSSQVSESSSGTQDLDGFLRRELAPLIAYLVQRQLSIEDARDVAQDAQIRLMRYRDQPPAVLRALMYRIALNLVRDRYRRGQARPSTVQLESIEGAGAAVDPEPGPDTLLSRQQQLLRIRDAIQKLPSHCRKIYLLNRIEGMSYPLIARHTGVTVKAVEKQISKALALLRRELGTESMFTDHDD